MIYQGVLRVCLFVIERILGSETVYQFSIYLPLVCVCVCVCVCKVTAGVLSLLCLGLRTWQRERVGWMCVCVCVNVKVVCLVLATFLSWGISHQMVSWTPEQCEVAAAATAWTLRPHPHLPHPWSHQHQSHPCCGIHDAVVCYLLTDLNSSSEKNRNMSWRSSGCQCVAMSSPT